MEKRIITIKDIIAIHESRIKILRIQQWKSWKPSVSEEISNLTVLVNRMKKNLRTP